MNKAQLPASTNASDPEVGSESNLVDSVTRSLVESALIVLNVIAMVVASVAAVAFLNALVSFFFGLLGYEFVTFDWLIGKAFVPLAFVMGVPWEECHIAGNILGVKVSRVKKLLTPYTVNNHTYFLPAPRWRQLLSETPWSPSSSASLATSSSPSTGSSARPLSRLLLSWESLGRSVTLQETFSE